MSKKRLHTDGIVNELAGASLFFQPRTEENEQPERTDSPLPLPQETKAEVTQKEPKQIEHDTVIPRYHDTITPSNHDTMTPRYHGEILEEIQRAVKQFGKKAATHRFTDEEKRALARIEFDFQEKKIQTSENELTRIAINFLIEDYRRHGDQSVLAKVLEKLHQ
jgi:hypothetical protein